MPSTHREHENDRQLLLAQLDGWRKKPNAGTFPNQALVDYVKLVGKHFLPVSLLMTLQEARLAIPNCVGDPVEREVLLRFLNIILDKRDNRYDYISYIALPLLGADPQTLTPNHSEGATRTRIALLVGDALIFETGAALGLRPELPLMRPGFNLLQKRLRHGLRMIRSMRPDSARVISDNLQVNPAVVHKQLIDFLDIASMADRSWLSMTVLPVYVVHDEYLFIRVLQSFESLFAFLALDAEDCIQALNLGDVSRAIGNLSSAADMFLKVLPLFSLLATLQRDAFTTFREYTEGASAIQSVNYKTFESICGTPSLERLHSPSFTSVPPVQARVLEGRPTIQGT
ncbi:tryptophan 2,3-dioxygenase, partial [Streptomyces tubercidicus]|uniref:tryptophan 2,3-dioxygenase n=2 Tax=Streptomyces TaxID=1883 RepID=UPI0036A4578E